MINLEIKCPGCGATIQTVNENENGYIKKEVLEKRGDNFLCERCFKLKHYNEVKKVDTKNIDFDSIFNKISKESNLIVNIIDAFDLLGSVISNINELFPKSKILIIANKYDLFLRSNRPTKIRRYIKEYLNNKNINFCDCLVTSSISDDSGNPIYEAIKKYSDGKKVYFVGVSNVGKSTLLNTISKTFGEVVSLTTSIQVGTTLDVTTFKVKDIIYSDTPGYYNLKQATHYLDKKSLNLTIPKKYIKPRIYQLYKDDTIFINAFGYLTYKSDDKCGIGFYVANTLMLYRSKNDPLEYYNKHLSDLLKVPNKQELSNLGGFSTYEINIEKDEELALSGIGFISFSIPCIINLTIPSVIEYEVRKKLI